MSQTTYKVLDKANSSLIDTEITAINSADNDLVKTLMQKYRKSEEDKISGFEQLNKPLKSSLVCGLLQQTS